ncbi:Zn-ribbon domain-containing OB-fold protein [Chloroflexota bacterium]
MSFENFGKVNFTTETRAEDFMKYLEQGKVMTTKCKKCETSYFPPRMDCPKCLLSDVEWFEIKSNGKLITYSVVHYSPSGFEDDAPYILAVGEFGNGLRVFGRLSKDINESNISIGMVLKLIPIKLPGDRVSYEFQKG